MDMESESLNGTEEAATGVDYGMEDAFSGVDYGAEADGEGLMLKSVANADAPCKSMANADSMPHAALKSADEQVLPVPSSGFRSIFGAVKSFGQKMHAELQNRADREQMLRAEKAKKGGQRQGRAHETMFDSALEHHMKDIDDPAVRKALSNWRRTMMSQDAVAEVQQKEARQGRNAAAEELKDKLAGKASNLFESMHDRLGQASGMVHSLFGAAHGRQDMQNAQELQDDARRFGPQAGGGVPC